MNIEQLLDQLSKIFPTDNQDFEILNILKKIKSILFDPSLEKSDKLAEIKERLAEIQKFYNSIKYKEHFLHSTLLWKMINTLLSNEELDLEEKIKLIKKIVEEKNRDMSNDSKTSFKIREILTDHSLNLEQKRNTLEAFLITNIQQQTALSKKNTYKLALKIALYDRLYYVDELGQLEIRLLMLPSLKTSNPDFAFANYPSEIPYIWSHINDVRTQISACFDEPKPYCSKLEELAKLINILINKYSQIETDPDATQEKQALHTQTKDYMLRYLNICANATKVTLVQKSEQSWSLWASAALEALTYLEHIKSDSYLQYVVSNPDKRKELIANELQIHTIRAKYIISQSLSFEERIGYYAEYKLSSSTQDINKALTEEPSQDLKLDEFFIAHEILVNHKTKNELQKSLDIACILESRGHSLGTFIRYVTYILKHPLSEKILHEYLNNLQSIGIPVHLRNHVADLWLCLAEFLNDQFKEAALLCLDQISDRYPLQSVLNAKLKRAQFSKNTQQIISYEKEITQLKEKARVSVLQHSNSTPLMVRQDQLLLCKLYTKTYAFTTDFFTEVLQNKNPYCLTEVISLLELELTEFSCVKEAVTLKYGESHTNPLILCESVLNTIDYNAYLITWKRLLLNTQENGYSPSVKQWLDNGFSRDNIRFKLLNDVRSSLQRYMFKHDVVCVIPGGCNIFTDLNIELQQVTHRIILAHHEDIRSNTFAFTRNREGLLEAIYALILLEDGNYDGAAQMAKLSIMKAPSINETASSPRKSPQESGTSPRSVHAASGNPQVKRNLFSKQKKQVELSPPSREVENTGRRRTPFTLSSEKLSSSSPNLSTPLKKSPRSKDKSIKHQSSGNLAVSSLSLSPRSESSAIQSQSYSTQPTCLGHLVEALVIWDTRLKNNTDRQESDIDSFKRSLKEARLATDPQELSFILGMIWLTYYDCMLNNKEKDMFMLTSDEQSLLKNPHKVLSSARIQYLEQNAKILDLNITDQCILEIAKQHFENACLTKSWQSRMFPPAIIAIYKSLMYFRENFACGNAEEVEKLKRFWAKLLKEAVLTHGYLPGLAYYAQVYAYAEEPKPQKGDEILKTIETTSDTLRLLHDAFSIAEKYIHIEPDQKKDMEQQIKSHKEKENEIALRIPSYAIETPKPFDHLFQKLQFEMEYHNTLLSCSYSMSNEESAKQCFVITCTSNKLKHTQLDCESLKEKFERAAFIYSCCRKISFKKGEPVVLLEKNKIILKNADIAIIGLIRIAEAKDTILKWNSNQIEPLILFLKEASTFPSTVWQWDETFTRLQEFIATHTTQNKLLM